MSSEPTYSWSDYYSVQSDYDAAVSLRDSLESQIERLNAAYSSLSSYKDAYSTQRSYFENSIYNGTFSWLGQNHDEVIAEFGTFGFINVNFGDCLNKIDDILDDINWNIANKQTALDVCNGDILSLGSTLRTIYRYLSTLVENVTN